MIKDAEFARRETIVDSDQVIELRFIPNTDKLLSEEDRLKYPIPQLTQKYPLVFPANEPAGVLHGLYLIGKVPKNLFELAQMKRDWAVIRADTKEDYLDEYPPLYVPILATLEDRRMVSEGMIVPHVIKDADGMERTEDVFIELIRKPMGDEILSVAGTVKFGQEGNLQQVLFVPQRREAIIGWTYVTKDGAMNKPRVPMGQQWTEYFLDCEFDDERRSLISVGIVNVMGRVHYAFDSKAASETKNQWIQDNVNTVLLDVPPGTKCCDLVANNKTWAEWLEEFFASEDVWHHNVIIHVDFPTDVGYIAPLLHLGEGRRIGNMPKLQFHIDYVDPYPTTIKEAKQHNAAWDAVVLWHHLGYYSFKVIHDLGRSAELHKQAPYGSRASMPAE